MVFLKVCAQKTLHGDLPRGEILRPDGLLGPREHKNVPFSVFGSQHSDASVVDQSQPSVLCTIRCPPMANKGNDSQGAFLEHNNAENGDKKTADDNKPCGPR